MTLEPLDVPGLLRQYSLRSHKGLGQNFLQDESALRKIVAAADLGPADAVLEIGPGLGSLTRHLSLAARSVTAVELDQNLFPALNTILAPYPNVRLVQGDILALDPADLMDTPGYLVVANIPYYITSAVIRHLLAKSPHGKNQPSPRRIVLTVQKEVAERICAGPGRMSLLALSVQVYGKPEVVATIPAGAFYPVPKVDSAVVRIDIYPEPVIPGQLLETFFRLAKAGFGQKRKTLRNSLASLLGREKAESLLSAAGIDPQRRAETLSLEEWRKISKHEAVESRQSSM
jgi:16S rRNA (adenine1518-N6/adenine1519-N6)-dimethyltransferase